MHEYKIKGNIGEKVVCDYLKEKGYKVLATNYHSRYGEIDIIAENESYIVFVEVKSRRQNSMISGIEAISKNKISKIIKTVFVFLINNPSNKQPRLDAAEVTMSFADEIKSINYIENAFDLEEYDAFF